MLKVGSTLAAILILLLFSATAIPTGAEKPTVRPNMIIFYVDDMGYGDIGVYGNTRIRTPNLDRMAAEGVRFTEYYAPAPACTASRAGMLTGRYPVRYGMGYSVFFPDATTGIPAEELTLAENLSAAGYRTGLFGKWHLGHQRPFLPLQHGFHEFNGTPFSNDMVVNVRMEGNEIVDFDPDQRFFTRQFTEAAMAFIERSKNEPFLAIITHPMPHVPLFASPQFDGRSGQGIYTDVIEEIDWSVGAVRQRLDELGLSDNTFVFFTSDNGPWLEFAEHGGSAGHFREGKLTTFEGAMRVPAIALWPGVIDPGRVQAGVLTGLDLMPTLSAWAHAPLPEDRDYDGTDMTGLILKGQEFQQDRYVACFKKQRLDALRVGDWKIKLADEGRQKQWLDIQWPGAYPDHGLLLFNLANDPGETINLAAQHPERVTQLLAEMARFEDQMGDLPKPMNMGSWAGSYTADLNGAQPPPRPSLEYRDLEIQRRYETLGIVPAAD